jgi:hypothetical protein
MKVIYRGVVLATGGGWLDSLQYRRKVWPSLSYPELQLMSLGLQAMVSWVSFNV